MAFLVPDGTDNPFNYRRQVNFLWKYMNDSKSILFFTGPGVSEIPAQFHNAKEFSFLSQPDLYRMEHAPPSFAVEFLRLLEIRGKLGYIMTENCDNQHARARISAEKLIQFHGNCFKVKCNQCNRIYTKQKLVRSYGNRQTGERCGSVGCCGQLFDTRIDWQNGANKKAELKICVNIIQQAEMIIAIGTSFEKPPFNFLAEYAINCHKLMVSINETSTKYDDKMSLVIRKNPSIFLTDFYNEDRNRRYSQLLKVRQSLEMGLEIPIHEENNTGYQLPANYHDANYNQLVMIPLDFNFSIERCATPTRQDTFAFLTQYSRHSNGRILPNDQVNLNSNCVNHGASTSGSSH